MKKNTNENEVLSVKTKDIIIDNEPKEFFTYKRVTLFIRLLIILTITFVALFVIGCHSTYLIKPFIKWTMLLLSIVSFGYLIIFIIKFVLIKDKKKTKYRWIWNILTYLYLIGASVMLVLLYGPDYGFRDWLVTTAMGTMHHHYYCEIFYSDKEIEESLGRNYIIEPEGETDTSLVDFDIKDVDTITDENAFEKQILDREKNQVYKMLKFKVNGEQAYLAVIYDPSRVVVGYTRSLNKNGEYVTSMAKRNNALVATNGGGFSDPGHKGNGSTPTGVTMSKGKIITDRQYPSGQGVIGLDNNNVLVLYKNKNAQQIKNLGVRDCVTRGPFLIVNGKSAITSGNGGWGYAARTAIGQRKDGIVLLLVVDSNSTRTNGASMKDLAKIFETYGAVNAAALDGGTSSVMVENGELISDPIDSSLKHKTRPIATSILVI